MSVIRILLLLPILAATAAPKNPLIGTWRGTSLCTPVRAACRDEIAVYHIAPSPKENTVLLTANKVVDGKEVEMGGTVEYKVDYAKRTLIWEMTARDGSRHAVILTWTGNEMTGTLVQYPGREVVRNMKLTKQAQ